MAATATYLLLLLAVSWRVPLSACSAAVTLLRARSEVWSDAVCAVYNDDWGSVPTTNHPSSWYRAEEASDGLACQPLTVTSGAIVSRRGNCSFCEKAEYAELANASLLVVVYNDSDLSVEPVCSHGDHIPTIPVLLVTNESGRDILHTLTVTNLTLAPFTPPPVTFDPAAIVTLFVAVVTVVLGSYIANTPFQFMRYGLLVRRGESYGEREEGEEEEGGRKMVMMTLLAIVVFLVLICAMLLLLYYFYYPMVYVVIAVYCVGASVGLFYLLSPFAALIPFMTNVRLPANKLPVLEYRPDPRFPLAVLLCVGFTVWWLVERHSSYAWILQNFLGFAFLTHILSRMLFIPTWVAAVAMVFLFFYDIIMVFVTPFLTEDHQSVMVKAATGGSGRTTETLPIVFIVPKFLPSLLDRTCSCLVGYLPHSLLGYGDVGVPGLLVSLALKFDMTHRPGSRWRPYFCVSSIAYCVGLVFTYLALFFMKTAQPALLYLVPTTLGSVAVLALCRRELCLFFTGKRRRLLKTPSSSDSKRRGHVQAAMETDTENSDGEKETLIH